MSTLADLMKAHEHAYRRSLDTSQYVLLRLDGKSFHSYTKRLQKPFDGLLMEAMDRTLLALCEQVQGVRFGYVESDEISLLLTAWREDPASPTRRAEGELWMGGVEAKLLSLSAAIATAAFNSVREEQYASLAGGPSYGDFHRGPALFDSRLWTFPATEEGRELVQKYFAWRRRDSIKNSVTMAALDAFSHKAIHGLKTEEKMERLREAGKPWEELPLGFQYGRTARKVTELRPVTYTHGKTGEEHTTEALRSRWELGTAEALSTQWDSVTLPRP